ITDNDVAGTPAWTDDADDPPFAPRKALKIARQKLAELVKPGAPWNLDSLTLQEWHDRKHWIYVARFEMLPPGDKHGLLSNKGVPITMTIPVLMSGIAVSPEIAPKEVASPKEIVGWPGSQVFMLPQEAGFQWETLELKDGRFRYWFSSDVIVPNPPEYP